MQNRKLEEAVQFAIDHETPWTREITDKWGIHHEDPPPWNKLLGPVSTPETHYARSGEVNIAYQVIGEGRLDLVLALGFATHVEVLWELPAYAHFVERLTSFARVTVFDKCGMGLSDRPSVLTTFEEQLDDIRAVLDAIGSERAAVTLKGVPGEWRLFAVEPRSDYG